MNQIKKKVEVNLLTMIEDRGEKEHNEVKESGDFFQKGNMDVLMFEEKTEEGFSIKNLITIQADKVNIKRTGVVTMNQKFHTDHITENVYKHPHGTIHMETFTNQIDYQSINQAGKGHLAISYTVKLNGQDERKHTLDLRLKEEEAE